MIQSHEKELDEPALVEFYTHLRNICILTLNAHPDDDEMYNLLFKLYKDNLNRGYFHYEGKLHPSRYLAISEYAARMNKYDWAFEFIEKYKDQIIGETETQDVYRLNLAMYYFGIGKFQDCLDNIPGSLSYVDYQITAKRLEIKALFELKSSLLDYKLDAFKMYLSRTSPKLLSPPRRQMNLDFANFMQQI
ncbi:MAG: hypothetical protein JNJ57_08085, partial [Saprospiraceae bacterium]|nr:hypothetical protein [Saprospiraceae bacterium]